jgi:short-subunit dehydrogenase
MRIEGSTCLVTGASSGIGEALALELGRRGGRIVATGRDGDRVRAVAERTGGLAVVADLARHEEIERVAREAGPVDILANNAGLGWSGSFEDIEPARIDVLCTVNLLAPLLLTRLLLPGMRERGRGHVVNVASVAGHLGVKHEAVYAATKAGLVGFTESLQQELRGAPLGVTLVSPGVIATRMLESREVPYDRRFPRPLPAERLARAIADAVERDAELVVLPRWLQLPIRLHGAAPRLYRALASRFG